MTAHQLRRRNWFGRSALEGFVHRGSTKRDRSRRRNRRCVGMSLPSTRFDELSTMTSFLCVCDHPRRPTLQRRRPPSFRDAAGRGERHREPLSEPGRRGY